MPKDNGKVPGTFVSSQEMRDLGALLTTQRDYIVSHEARLDAIEEWILEFLKANADEPEVVEGEVSESTDDPSQG